MAETAKLRRNRRGIDGEPTPELPDRVEGELRLFGGDPITLDPACASDAGSAEYIVEIFSGLVSFDKDLNVIPDIAETIEVSPDGLVYTFHLRTNVEFHDASRRVTADDFKFSMERALNPDTQSTVGEVYLDDIVGADEFIAGSAEEVTGIKVVNADTLEITIKEPSVVLPRKLTYPTAYVVDQREVERLDLLRRRRLDSQPERHGPLQDEGVGAGRAHRARSRTRSSTSNRSRRSQQGDISARPAVLRS